MAPPWFKTSAKQGWILTEGEPGVRHVPPPPPPVLEEFKRACGLLSFSSHTLTHPQTNSPSPACSCIYAWSALPLVPSAHFIIHTYCTVATGNTTISASTTHSASFHQQVRLLLHATLRLQLPQPPLKWTYGCRLPFKKKFFVFFFSFESRTSEFTSLVFVSGVFLFPTNQEEGRRSPLEGLISVLPGLDQGCISLMKHQPHGSESISCMLRSRAYRVSGKRVM